MIAGAGSLQKLLHLANAREALSAGDFPQALSEVDAAVAADATFVAAHSLRREILARMNTVSQPVMQPPRAHEQIVTPAPVVKPAPAQPRRRTRSEWPARARVGLSLVALLAVGMVAVILVRSGGTQTRSETASNPPAQASRAAVRAPESSTTPSRSAADIALPVTKPAPPPQSAPAASSQVESTEWTSPRLARLNVRPRWRASAMHVDDAALLRDLGQGISELWVGRLTGNEDAIFVGGSLDESDWAKLRASIKPTGVVWRIYSHRSAPLGATLTNAAFAAGFTRGREVRYSSDFVAEQYTPHRKGR
jgi:hypothetical protein